MWVFCLTQQGLLSDMIGKNVDRGHKKLLLADVGQKGLGKGNIVTFPGTMHSTGYLVFIAGNAFPIPLPLVPQLLEDAFQKVGLPYFS